MQEINTDLWKQRVKPYDQIIEYLLIALLVFMPLTFGAVQAWSQEIMLALAAALSIVFALRLICVREIKLIWSWAYVPLGMFIFITLFQLIPLPTRFVSLLSPYTVRLRQELLGDLPDAEQLLKMMTISLYPHATWHDLRIVLAIATIFVVVFNVYRQPTQIKRLLTAVSVIGASVALLALAQDLLGNGKIYWFVKILRDSNPVSGPFAGTFANHSHYGQFMNLSIGAALGLILVIIHETFFGEKITPLRVSEFLGSSQARFLWLLMGFIILGAATVFVSLTRGGMVSMLIATVCTTLLLSMHHSIKGRGWIMAIMALGAFICVLYVGFDAVCDRLATMRDIETAEGGRWQMVKNTAVAWTHVPIFGTGLGTYVVIYPAFDNAMSASLATHAENEYIQVLAETGILGLLALLGFLAFVLLMYIHNIRTYSIPICITAYGLGFGLIAVMFHSLSDFGQHLPANAALSTIFCALLLAIAKVCKEANNPVLMTDKPRAKRVIYIVILIGLCLIWSRLLYDADRARRAAAHWKQALILKQRLIEKDWQGSDTEYVDLLSQAAVAADLQPTDIHYHHWLNVFRWYSLTRLRDPNTADVVLLPETVAFAEQIVTELHKARLLCPTFGATYCVAGQIEKWVLDKPCGDRHIRQGYRLAPCDPTVCLSVGLLEAHEGQADEAFENLYRAIQLNSGLFKESAAVCIRILNRPDMALNLAGESTGRLNALVYMLDENHEGTVTAEHVHAQIRDLLEQKCRQPNAPASVYASLAYIYVREGQKEEAIDHYRQALALDYGKVNWRYSLARTLADIGAVSDAIHEARICLRLRPGYVQAERLIADLSIRAEAFKQIETH